jgi:hypothetical protein
MGVFQCSIFRKQSANPVAIWRQTTVSIALFPVNFVFALHNAAISHKGSLAAYAVKEGNLTNGANKGEYNKQLFVGTDFCDTNQFTRIV